MNSNEGQKFNVNDLATSGHSLTSSASCIISATLESHLECPVCLVVPKSGPIYQCRNGHLLCHQCHPKLKRCPLCKIPLEKLRNLLAEQLAAMIEPNYQSYVERSTQETIWRGPLTWKINSKMLKNVINTEQLNESVDKTVNVDINTIVLNGFPQVSSAYWPTTLVMQLVPIRIMRQVGKDFFSNSYQVFLGLPEKDDFNMLKTYLYKTGVAGVIHFINAPGCEISLMVLLYSWEKEMFVGFIPHDQINFIQSIRDEIKKETPKNIC